jgi:diadenosine tetraphosphate (Ap4A) HIT family hydrolase
MFKLHSKLNEDLIPLGNLKISKLLLMPDSENPWLILVPQREGIKEWHHLEIEDQHLLMTEINSVSNFIENEYSPDKINIGSLGNMVSQFHVHIIGRFIGDKCWPASIWGSDSAKDQNVLKNWERIVKKHFSF